AELQPPQGGAVCSADWGSDWLVTVERVGIYVCDSFDFNDLHVYPEPLGFWDETTKTVSKSGNPFNLVTNGDYRDFRKNTGKGGDLMVFSDVKIISQATPWSFHASGISTPAAPPMSLPPSLQDVNVRRGDTLSGLAQKHYGDWRLWPLIWDRNAIAVGPRP